jgi:hypothetical protein
MKLSLNQLGDEFINRVNKDTKELCLLYLPLYLLFCVMVFFNLIERLNLAIFSFVALSAFGLYIIVYLRFFKWGRMLNASIISVEKLEGKLKLTTARTPLRSPKQFFVDINNLKLVKGTVPIYEYNALRLIIVNENTQELYLIREFYDNKDILKEILDRS